jgi:prepilin-type processing-associated H-X9-DG protein
MKARSNHARPAAFTIIELLVSITVIATMIAMLLPAISKARGAAQTVVCATHLKQIDLAAATFSNDNNGYIPPNKSLSWWLWGSGYIIIPYNSMIVNDSTTSVPANMRNWRTGGGTTYTNRMFAHYMMMGGYITPISNKVSSGTVFDCPAYHYLDLRRPDPYPRTNLNYWANGYNQGRYNVPQGFNPNNDDKFNATFFKTPTQRIDLLNSPPSKTVMYADRVMIQIPYNGDPLSAAHYSDEVGFDWNDTDPNRRWAQRGTNGNAFSIWFHETGLNVAFYDGSVRLVSREEADRATYSDQDIFYSLTPVKTGYNNPYVWPIY